MIQEDGINRTNPSTFKSIVLLKFFLSIVSLVIILMIWCSYDYNIFCALGLKAMYKNEGDNKSSDDSQSEGNDESDDYNKAFYIILIGLIIYTLFLVIDLAIQISGMTYSYNKGNVINVMLKVLEVFLLFYFFIDSWHYVIIWYIFIVTQFICTLLEISGLIYSLCYKFSRYDYIRKGKIVLLEKTKKD